MRSPSNGQKVSHRIQYLPNIYRNLILGNPQALLYIDDSTCHRLTQAAGHDSAGIKDLGFSCVLTKPGEGVTRECGVKRFGSLKFHCTT